MKIYTKEDVSNYIIKICKPEISIQGKLIEIIKKITEYIYDLNMESLPMLTKKETKILRRLMGIYTNGQPESYEKIGSSYGKTKAVICNEYTKIKRNIIIYVYEQAKKTSLLNITIEEIVKENDVYLSVDRVKNKKIIDILSQTTKNENTKRLSKKIIEIIKEKYNYNFMYVGIKTPEIMEQSIGDFIQDSNIQNKLIKNKVYTVIDLISLTTDEILKLNNLSKETKLRIIRIIHEKDMLLADEISIDNINRKISNFKMKKFYTDTFLEQPINLFIDISNLKFSARTYNCLKRLGKNNLNDVIHTKISELYKTPGIGETIICEIIDTVHYYNQKMQANPTIQSVVEIDENIPKISIKNIGLPQNIYLALLWAEKPMLSDLLSMSISELYEIDGIANNQINQIVNFIHSIGYYFRDDSSKKKNENQEISVENLTKLVESKKNKREELYKKMIQLKREIINIDEEIINLTEIIEEKKKQSTI